MATAAASSSRPAWVVDELSEEWIQQSASGSAGASGPPAGGSVAINGTIQSGQLYAYGSVVERSAAGGSVVERSSGLIGSVVVKSQGGDGAGAEAAPWLQAAVSGLGGMFGPNKLERIFQPPVAGPSRAEGGTTRASVRASAPPAPNFVTPSAALLRRSLRRSVSQSTASDSQPFDFVVPRNHASWKTLQHFAPSAEGSTADQGQSTSNGGSVIEHHVSDRTPEGHAHLLEPTPRPQQGRFFGGSRAVHPIEEESTQNEAAHSDQEALDERSLAFAQETPAMRVLASPKISGSARRLVSQRAASSQGSAIPQPSSRPLEGQGENPSSSDRIFHFTYDTFTRDHLSRLVEEIDDFSGRSAAAARQRPVAEVSIVSSAGPAHSTPPALGAAGSRDGSGEAAHGHVAFRAPLTRQRREDEQWARSFTDPNTYARISTSGQAPNNDEEEDVITEACNGFGSTSSTGSDIPPTRSSKRIRLVLPNDSASPSKSLARRQRDSVLVASERRSGQSPMKRACPVSARRDRRFCSDTASNSPTPTPAAPRRAAAPASVPAPAPTRLPAPASPVDPTQRPVAASVSVPASATSSADPTQNVAAKPRRDLLAEARELMARLKAKSSHEPASPRRSTTTPSPPPVNGDGPMESRDSTANYEKCRPRAPTPTRASWFQDEEGYTGDHTHDQAARKEQTEDAESSHKGTAEHDDLPPARPQYTQGMESDGDREDDSWEGAARSLTLSPEEARNQSPRKLLRKIGAAEEVGLVDRLEDGRTVNWTLEDECVRVELEDGSEGAEARYTDDEGGCWDRGGSEQGDEEDEVIDPGRAEVHRRLASAAAASLRQALGEAPDGRQPQGSTSSSNSATNSMSNVPRRHFATQPVHQSPGKGQTRPALPLSASVPAPTSRTASSTTAVTMTASSAKMSVFSGASLGHLGARNGLMTIAPEDVEELLNQGRVGKMVFDPATGRWIRARRISVSGAAIEDARDVRTAGEAIAEENEDDGSVSEEDIFKDIETLNSRRDSPFLPSQTSSGVEQAAPTTLRDEIRAEEDEVNPEDEGKPAHLDDDEQGSYSILPVAADVPDIPEAGEGNGEAADDAEACPPSPVLPRSALKCRPENEASASPLQPRDDSRAGRSVSFSDGRTHGKIVGLREQLHRTPNALQREVEQVASSDSTPESSVQPSARTKQIQTALDELRDAAGTPSSVASNASSSLLALSTSRKVRAKAGMRRTPSGTPTEANATITTECSFGISHERLLKAITDVEPYEPAWDQLKIMDLGSKGIESVARLKEWLPGLDELNLESNTITYLAGLPSCLRTLLLPSNRLSSITSFAHLPNLERLDVSHNEIDAVQQLAGLRHLRELKADHNNIVDVGGLADLDSLIKLSLKGNQLHTLHCESTRWSRLEVLNLSKNTIGELTSLESLPMLHLLNLDHNDLYSLELGGALPRLRVLRICDNHLEQLDVRPCANLRTLFIDNCSLVHLDGTSRLRKLENLSIRDQRGQSLVLPTKHIRDVKRLYLSGNPLPDNFPTYQFFNLAYLELAMCQCRALPPNLASSVPNVRYLNLNYNFLTDLGPVSKLQRLQKLSVLGSRLKSCARGVVQVLCTLPELEVLDLRMNPATLAFYPPLLMEDAVDDATPHADYRIASSRARWSEVDHKFRHSLPQEYYLRRATYRALVLFSCSRLRLLDGLAVEKGERARSGKLLRSLSRKVESGEALMGDAATAAEAADLFLGV